MKRRGWILAAALFVAACGGAEREEGALSSDEERQLNEAAAMLDDPVDAPEEAERGDEDAPEDER